MCEISGFFLCSHTCSSSGNKIESEFWFNFIWFKFYPFFMHSNTCVHKSRWLRLTSLPFFFSPSCHFLSQNFHYHFKRLVSEIDSDILKAERKRERERERKTSGIQWNFSIWNEISRNERFCHFTFFHAWRNKPKKKGFCIRWAMCGRVKRFCVNNVGRFTA